MIPFRQIPSVFRVLGCWNWKCALMSASVRSMVYALAMARGGQRGSLAVILVEMLYVTLTAGVYAGLQQRALALRARPWGALLIVVAVPALSQALDWLAHWASGAVAPPRATFAVWAFTLVSALFHLYVMRRGAFLTGRGSHTLAEDFRRIPQLVLRFLAQPFAVGARLLGQIETAGWFFAR
jgi:hypothetical protein